MIRSAPQAWCGNVKGKTRGHADYADYADHADTNPARRENNLAMPERVDDAELGTKKIRVIREIRSIVLPAVAFDGAKPVDRGEGAGSPPEAIRPDPHEIR